MTNQTVLTKEEEAGIEYLAGWVAKTFWEKYPHISLKCNSSTAVINTNEMPSWVSQLRYGGMVVPSNDFLNSVKEFENVFLSYHGCGDNVKSISTEEGIVKKGH